MESGWFRRATILFLPNYCFFRCTGHISSWALRLIILGSAEVFAWWLLNLDLSCLVLLRSIDTLFYINDLTNFTVMYINFLLSLLLWSSTLLWSSWSLTLKTWIFVCLALLFTVTIKWHMSKAMSFLDLEKGSVVSTRSSSYFICFRLWSNGPCGISSQK